MQDVKIGFFYAYGSETVLHGFYNTRSGLENSPVQVKENIIIFHESSFISNYVYYSRYACYRINEVIGIEV